MPKAFRDLSVWQKSVALATTIYRLTEDFPRSELYGLTSQMRRAAVSIPSNIAEGHARNTRKDFSHFLSIARGSNHELQTHCEIARNLGFGHKASLEEAEAASHEIGKMLSALDAYLQKAPPKSRTNQN